MLNVRYEESNVTEPDGSREIPIPAGETDDLPLPTGEVENLIPQ